ncbi:aminotransferase class V-fold PLP-dependent enzyme [uncultured Roseovarius sp.]|uniref:pyridoxal-phosphate-dependent aminotransferase family protein n=1 Tax=uncultured Roseovarius sp. TaxID=293344 RepID=UPI00262DCEA7|nr:aminotransferase class V-fold PLP-dependent enzyme [uncultured Roseovarius sp.]
MSLAHGRPYLAIPGPSVMPDAVLRAMHRASPNIYAGELDEITASLIPDLADIARTKGKTAIYIGNGHAAWEAALVNTLSPGDKVLVPATGRFGLFWADMAVGLGIVPQIIDYGRSQPVDPQQIEDMLRADKAHEIKAVLATHVDTSTSVRNDISAIRAAMNAAGHPALLMADCIASLVCDRYEMDAWGVDVTLAASQKGLMVPPGLAFVWFNEKAAEVRAGKERVSRYWDWSPRVAPQRLSEYFCGTAPTHHVYGLRAALDMIKQEGLEAIWQRHELLARAVWAACEAWAQGGPLRLNVADPAHRGHEVTALSLGAPHGTALRTWLESKADVTLGIGLGMETPEDPKSDGFFRIGHMGHVNAHMVMGVLGTVQAGMSALDIPYGSGALDAAAAVMAEA